MEKFTQKNIFAYNMLKASKCHLDENYSYLHSLLLHLENQFTSTSDQNIENFSQSLMEAINLSKAFFPVDRICLALTYPQGTRIRTLSAANSEKILKNLMPTNYSCFVSKKSSILKTENSNVRIYSDIDEIIQRYKEGDPIQRSLRLLREMGLRSGITIPLPISDFASGFLFINSVYKGTFDELQPEDYSTLCLMKMVATSVLSKSLSFRNNLDSELASSFNKESELSNIFSAAELKNIMEKVLTSKYEKNISIEINRSTKIPLFYSMKPMIFLLVKAFESTGYFFSSDKVELEIGLKQIDEIVFLETVVKNLSLTEKQLKNLQMLKVFSEHNVSQENGYLALRTEAEMVQNPDYDYSV
jgi:hypothetical protein